MQPTRYEIHPAAEVFPMMGPQEFEQLKEDIRQHGVKTYITLFDGKIIDGRNRYKACLEIGIDPAANVEEMEECEDPIAFVLSLNLHRRHLNETQRATVAAKVATLRKGGQETNGSIDPFSQPDAAKMLNVSVPSVRRAKHAIDNGAPEVVAAMERGEIAASAAAKLVDAVTDKAEQAEIVKQGKKAVAAKTKQAKADKAAEQKKPLDTQAKGECIAGGPHKWTRDQDGVEYCLSCCEDKPGSKPEKAAKPEHGIIEKVRPIWNAANKSERIALKVWINEQT